MPHSDVIFSLIENDDEKGSVTIQGLNEITVENEQDAYDIILDGSSRKFAKMKGCK